MGITVRACAFNIWWTRGQITETSLLLRTSMEGEESSGSGTTTFVEWVISHGGDSELLDVLKGNEFNSRFSLKNIDFNCPEGSRLFSQLNYGQGLVDIANHDQDSKVTPLNSYTTGASKAAELRRAGASQSLKQKLGKLFNFNPASHVDDDDFQLTPSGKGKSSFKRKFTSDSRQKGPAKKKVKQVTLSVVGLCTMTKRTPTGSARVKMTRDVWLNVGASEIEVKTKIVQTFGWKSMKIRFMYVQGKNLREASLSDVENSESWDLETVKALMGSGSLYVLKGEDIVSNEVVDEQNIVSVSNYCAVFCSLVYTSGIDTC